VRAWTVLVATLAMAAVASAAPAPLQIVIPLVSQSEGGAPDPPGFSHVPGEVLFFSCQVAGYQKDVALKIHLTYSIQGFDPAGVPFVEPVSNEITAEVTPQDREWKPKIRTEIPLPPLALPGTYKISVKVTDSVSKATATLDVPVEVRGREVEPSETLVVRNFRFFREEEDTEPLAKPAFRPGDPVWARFDVTGYKYGPNNRVDVSYTISVLAASGKVLWTQPEPAVEQSESFYPKRYVPASLSITLEKNFQPGEYALGVQVKDAVGNQQYETKAPFFVE
jgi:hypothetical protein